MFWVQAISADNASVDLAAETASLSVTGLATLDFHDVINALRGGPSKPATVSFDVKWSGATRRLGIRNETDGFVGRYIEDKATIKWSALQAGFKFESDPKQTSVYGVIGRERNGAFFKDNDEEKD